MAGLAVAGRSLDEAFEVTSAVDNIGAWGWLDVQGCRWSLKRLGTRSSMRRAWLDRAVDSEGKAHARDVVREIISRGTYDWIVRR
uniref:Uncharacterized protein n=1 Tax=Oryza meridionalis TaxID=40149 RepID=A0A0E0EN24_9ORYZ